MLGLDQISFGNAVFWSSVALLGFTYALAIQIRIIVPLTLRILLAAKWTAGARADFDHAIQNATRGIRASELEEFLLEQHSKTLQWIIVAKVISKISIAGLILCFIIGAFTLTSR